MTISKLIENLSMDPFNPQLNFDIAQKYNNIGQSASAVSFYLRAAEYGNTFYPEITYISLMKIGQCMDFQQNNPYTVMNSFLQAVAFMPERPEAYFLISQYYERQNKWQEAYTWAELGLRVSKNKTKPLDDNCGYLGEYCLDFEKAVSAWWIGKNSESIEKFKMLKELVNIDQNYLNAVNSNLERLGY